MKVIFDNIKGTCIVEGIAPRGVVCQWDAAQKTLSIARDKMGKKSLYYAQLPTSVIVSTELKEILPYIAYPQINMLNLAQPIRYNYPIDLQQAWINQIKRVRQLKTHPRYIPFYAFTWGRTTSETIAVLHNMGITPVLCNGGVNYNNHNYTDRMAIDGMEL